ncbi:hypothetical protein ES288_D13G129900v1 [Gossypium darwinii]|uniref:DUF7733 domain-containing protein n=1 Tax=Gossypium darwinii TaxID=34276 RepID=A0A5D1ZYS6_GOSDA|nr:hypothetical protein ES288_D13G129900v1 [Gossypium darwinii]
MFFPSAGSLNVLSPLLVKLELYTRFLFPIFGFQSSTFCSLFLFRSSTKIFSLVNWLRCGFTKVDNEYAGSGKRVYVGRVLALANMGFWCFNLFGLLPVYLPKAFKMYYSETKVKVVE